MSMKKWMATIVAGALLGASALFAGMTSDPSVATGDAPEYPLEARTKGIEGLVVIEALVDETGRVIAAEVIRTAHPMLDRAALAAVKGWTFTPALENGVAVTKVVHIPIRFSLMDPVEGGLMQGRIG